jgi:site-specific DNA recombinase
VALLRDRILEASVPSVISAYENKVRVLEEEKLALQERLASSTKPARSFEATFRTALDFLGNPQNLWRSDRLEDRRTVLKLTFAQRLSYRRGEGFRTADLSPPFKVLGGLKTAQTGWRARKDSNPQPPDP